MPKTGTSFFPFNLCFAVLLPVVLIGLASYFAILGILKISAAELMKGDTQKAKLNFMVRRLLLEQFKFNTKFQLREQLRSIPRLLFLVLGVAAASMVMLFGFCFNYAMNVALEKGMIERYVYPLEYNFKEVRNLEDGDVPEGAEPYYAFRCYVEGRESLEFYLIGAQVDSVGVKMDDMQGNALPRDQVNITSPLASRLKIKEGGTIHFVNKLDGKSYSLKIEGIIQAYGEQNVHLPLEEFNAMTLQAPGSYKGLLANHELDLDKSALAGVFDYRASGELKEKNMSNRALVTLIAVFAGLIAVVVIYLVTSLIIEESRSSLSLFKIFGYRRKEVSKLILNGSAPAVFAGFWLGLPLMLIFSGVLYNYVADIINMLTPIIIDPLYVLLSFVLIFAVYELTKRFFGRRIAKISMSEALKAGTE